MKYEKQNTDYQSNKTEVIKMPYQQNASNATTPGPHVKRKGGWKNLT